MATFKVREIRQTWSKPINISGNLFKPRNQHNLNTQGFKQEWNYSSRTPWMQMGNVQRNSFVEKEWKAEDWMILLPWHRELCFYLHVQRGLSLTLQEDVEIIRNIPEVMNKMSAPGMTDTFWGWQFVNEICSHSPFNLQHFWHIKKIFPALPALYPIYLNLTLGHKSFLFIAWVN